MYHQRRTIFWGRTQKLILLRTAFYSYVVQYSPGVRHCAQSWQRTIATIVIVIAIVVAPVGNTMFGAASVGPVTVAGVIEVTHAGSSPCPVPRCVGAYISPGMTQPAHGNKRKCGSLSFTSTLRRCAGAQDGVGETCERHLTSRLAFGIPTRLAHR